MMRPAQGLQTNQHGAAMITAAALLVWIAAQFGTLALAALRVPLSARFPVPAEQVAVHEMIVVQTVLASLLFPALVRSLAAAAATIGSAAIFLQFSGFIAAEPASLRLILSWIYVGVWLVCLAAVAHGPKSSRAMLHAVAAATLASAGGAITAYLVREFGSPTQALQWKSVSFLGPTVGALGVLEHGPRTGGAWVFLGCAVAAAGLWVAWNRRRPIPTA